MDPFPRKLLLVLILLWSGGPSQAGLLYYEGFQYLIGEDGLKYQGSFAATPDPAAGSDSDIAPGSLRYMDADGNVLLTSGNHAVVDTHEERGTVSNVAPILRLPDQQPAGRELWISFVGQQTAGTTTRFFNLSLRAPDDTIQPADGDTNMDEIVALGMPSGAAGQLWRVWDRGTNANLWTSAISTAPSTELSLVLVRIELNAVNDLLERYTLWINPPLGRPPDEAGGVSMISADSNFAAWSDLEQIRLAAGYNAGSPSGWIVDEIRIADTWQEALPYRPLQILSALPVPGTAQWRISWWAAPGFTDSIEWSADLTQWFPYPDSLRTHGSTAGPAEYVTPPDSSLQRYFRVRRVP